MKKKQKLHGQALVEYALLVTMITIPLIVIIGTLGDAAGQVWQTVIDTFETNPLFGVPHPTAMSYTATTYFTPTTEFTLTETITPGGPTLTPTETLVFTFTPSATETDVPAEIPSETATEVVVNTPIPSATAILLAVDSAVVTRKLKAIVVDIYVNRTAELSVKDTQGNITKSVICYSTCKVKFDPLDNGGYIEIRSDFGDELFIHYPPAE